MKFKILKDHFKESSILKSLLSLHQWDMETMMPSGAINDRALRLSYLESKIHNHNTSKKYHKLLNTLSKSKLTKIQKKLIQESLFDYSLKSKLPSKHIIELSTVTTHASHVWGKARKENDWKVFAPHLKKIVQLKKREITFFNHKNPYDSLLQFYERDYNTSEIEIIFNNLKEGLKPIIKNVSPSFLKENSFKEKFFLENQKKLNEHFCNLIGLPKKFSRLDVSNHPFSINISPYDQRITTRYCEDDFFSLYSTLHEIGHALYELHLPNAWEGSPLQESISLSAHESQSRFWENIIGRSKNFAIFLAPQLANFFPNLKEKFHSDKLFYFLNHSKPGTIRVDSCELYYNLHIIIRFEIEKALIGGDISVADLPDIWNQKYKDYLGIKVRNFSEGLLQDSHWAAGAFGYFPTYALGNLISATLNKKCSLQIKNEDQLIIQGNFSEHLNFMVKNLHSKGRMTSVKKIIPELGVEDYLEYLSKKLIET